MIVQASLVGGFPRPFNAGRIMSKYRDGKISTENYEERLEAELLKALTKISYSKVFLVPFNMFLWDDIFEPFASSFEGIERGGLCRFLDNNFYYRAPIIKGSVRHREATIDHLKTVKHIVRKEKLHLKFKAVLPGPYTFAKMSENKYYSSEYELVTNIAEALAEEVKMLEKLGISFIEVNEPLLALEKAQIDLFKKGFEILTSKTFVKVWLQTYFGPVSHLLQELSDLRIDVLGIDLVEAPQQFEAILGSKAKWGLSLGAVDCRSTRLEPVKNLRMLVQRTCGSFSRVYLTPNAMMDFIPVSVAYAKVRRIGMAIGGFRNE